MSPTSGAVKVQFQGVTSQSMATGTSNSHTHPISVTEIYSRCTVCMEHQSGTPCSSSLPHHLYLPHHNEIAIHRLIGSTNRVSQKHFCGADVTTPHAASVSPLSKSADMVGGWTAGKDFKFGSPIPAPTPDLNLQATPALRTRAPLPLHGECPPTPCDIHILAASDQDVCTTCKLCPACLKQSIKTQ